MRFTSVLLVVLELSLLAAAQQSGDPSRTPLGAATGMTTPSPTSSSSDCATLSAADPEMAPLAKVCEFARGFRISLPDFICQQTTTTNNLKVIQATVTFVNGKEAYSNTLLNGKPVTAKDAAIEKQRSLLTNGEFGSDLVHLFFAPIAAEFKFKKKATLSGQAAWVYGFRLSEDKNTFYTISVGQFGKVKPELQGELWNDPRQDRLLRLQLGPVSVPAFDITSSTTVINYADVPLGDAGVFLLPTSSDTTVCVKTNSTTGQGVQLNCYRNAMNFHDCQKFGSSTRIVDSH